MADADGHEGDIRPGSGSKQFNSFSSSIKKMSESVASNAFDAIDFTRAGVQYERLIQEWDKLNEVHLQLNIAQLTLLRVK